MQHYVRLANRCSTHGALAHVGVLSTEMPNGVRLDAHGHLLTSVCGILPG